MKQELDKISSLIETYPFIAVDTEYPGCIYQDRMPGPRDPSNHQFLYVKQNIDKTKIIQLGITLSDG
jgi:CCR4-NOT transcription complex subunit 7/8